MAKQQAGFSLVSVLISAGIMGVVLLTLTKVFTDQYKQSIRLTERLEVLDAKQALLSNFHLAKNCSCQFAPAMTFNSTVTNGSQSISLDRIAAGCSPTNNLFQVGDRDNSTMRIDAIELANLVPTSNAPTEDVWEGTFTIRFYSKSREQEIAPIELRRYFRISSPGTANSTISECIGANPGSIQVAAASVAGGLNHTFCPGNPLTCPLAVTQGPANAFLPYSHIVTPNPAYGARCDESRGWYRTGCFISSPSVDNPGDVDIWSVDNGCATNDFSQVDRIEFTVICVKT